MIVRKILLFKRKNLDWQMPQLNRNFRYKSLFFIIQVENTFCFCNKFPHYLRCQSIILTFFHQKKNRRIFLMALWYTDLGSDPGPFTLTVLRLINNVHENERNWIQIYYLQEVFRRFNYYLKKRGHPLATQSCKKQISKCPKLFLILLNYLIVLFSIK